MLLSLDLVPAELIPLVLTHLPPRDVLLSFALLSWRYRSLAADFFQPDGRPGVRVQLIHDEQTILPRNPRIGLPTHVRLAPSFAYSKGRRIVATLDVFVDGVITMYILDPTALAAAVESMGLVAFAGINMMWMPFYVPWIHVLFKWLTHPVGRPRVLEVDKNITELLYVIPGRPCFPGIERVTYRMSGVDVPQHLHESKSGLLPSCKSVTLEGGCEFSAQHTEAIPRIVEALSGRHSTTLSELVLTANHFDLGIFGTISDIVSALPFLQTIEIDPYIDWRVLPGVEDDKRLRPPGAAYRLKELRMNMQGILTNPLTPLLTYAKALSVILPGLNTLTLTLYGEFMGPMPTLIIRHKGRLLSCAEMLDSRNVELDESVCRAFVAFILAQPAQRVRLNFITVGPKPWDTFGYANVLERFGRTLQYMLHGRGGKTLQVSVYIVDDPY